MRPPKELSSSRGLHRGLNFPHFETSLRVTMSNSSESHGVVIDIIRRVILIEDENTIHDNSTLVYNAVPRGVNIFAMLSLEQPEDVTNLTDWKVALSSENPLYYNLTNVIKVKR